MGSQTSKTVLDQNHNHKEGKGGSSNSDVCLADLDMVDGDLAVDCLGALCDDPISCFQCLSLPFQICLGLLME